MQQARTDGRQVEIESSAADSEIAVFRWPIMGMKTLILDGRNISLQGFLEQSPQSRETSRNDIGILVIKHPVI